jgi:hypothetical protein
MATPVFDYGAHSHFHEFMNAAGTAADGSQAWRALRQFTRLAFGQAASYSPAAEGFV